MLKPTVFSPITGNRIRPRGWLKRQLEIQAAGLSGNLDIVWPDVAQSRWIGGDKEGWERVPYWLDGFIPLAWLLEDEGLKARAKKYIDAILAMQQEDGWICPCAMEERSTYDMWALMLIAKVLTVYGDLSGDERIVPALTRALAQFDKHIDKATLFNWSAARWYECLIPIFWLYEKDPQPWLLGLAHKLQVEGINYEKLFDEYQSQIPQRRWTYLTHVVNMGMCLKQGALVSRMDGSDPDAFAQKAIDTLLRYHSMAVGHFTGDECVAGDSPIQGSELCSVVEAMYSYEVLLATGGTPVWGDFIEKLAFNALPATISPDMWAHQYDQMTNQVQCTPFSKEHNIFGTNGPESHLFGLEPNFGCCTANFNQGWPKFALSTFMETEKGIVSTILAPSAVTTNIGGTTVEIALDTEFPFRDTLSYTIEAEKPVAFDFQIRIPGYAKAATVNGETAAPGTYFNISKEWSGRTVVEVSLQFDIALVDRPRDMKCLWRGPLLFSVPIVEKWEKQEYEKNGVVRKFPYCDYHITPQSPWNYGFAGTDFSAATHPIGEYPFSPESPAITIDATLAQIPWAMEHGVCTMEPQSRVPVAAPEVITMIPYGCTNLRMTEMPVVAKKSEW